MGIAGMCLVNLYASISVALARKKYGVDYPHCYAPESNKNKKAY